jgi:Tol biopolymer transport system component
VRKLIVFGLLAALAVLAVLFVLPAAARPPAANGQIAFARFNPALGDSQFYTVNPDGSHEQQVLPFTLECPHWSPDGTRIASCGFAPDGATAIINPDDGIYRVLPLPDPTLPTACAVWSPDGKRLACEMFEEPADPSRIGIYTIRSADGGGLTRMTSNPGGQDSVGDYSPDGRRFVFARSVACSPDCGLSDTVGLFVVNVNGTGLMQITPTGTLVSSGGNWSPQGNEIVFSRHVTEDVHSSLWVVHSDGSGLHEIHVQGVACGGANDDPNGVACFGPSWSPDGTKIVFAMDSGEGSNIFTINADGSGLTQVTHDGGDDPDWGTHPLAR